MKGRSIDIFFYGLFMDIELLQNQGVMPVNARCAFVDGFELRIGNRATLVPAVGSRAYGMLIGLTQHEIVKLYSQPGLQHYVPEAVFARTMEGQGSPALCYTLPEPPMASERNQEYAAKLQKVLQLLGFPAEYIESIQ